MKKLLLTSAIVAVAGAAAAEVTWSGDAEVGYKSHFKRELGKAYDLNGDGDMTDEGEAIAVSGSTDSIWIENTDNVSPLYYEAGLNAKASADLGNGVTASIDYDLSLVDPERYGGTVTAGGTALQLEEGFPTLTVEAPVGKFAIGEVKHAAESMVAETFEAATEFTEDKDDLVLRGDVTYSGVNAAMSYVVADREALDKYGLNKGSWTAAASGEFSGAKFAVGYESAENSNDKIDANTTFGIRAGYEFMGIDAAIFYGSKTVNGMNNATSKKYDHNVTSIGLAAKYTMSNGVKLGGEYTMNSTDAVIRGTNGAPTLDGSGKEQKGFGKDKDGKLYDSYNAYKVYAGFDAMGADITLGYKVKNDVKNAFDNKTEELGQSGVYVDAAYTIESVNVKLIGGYDATDAIVMYSDLKDYNKTKAEDRYGAFYVGAYYNVNDNASVFATYSNGNEINPDEDIDPGATLGVKLSF